MTIELTKDEIFQILLQREVKKEILRLITDDKEVRDLVVSALKETLKQLNEKEKEAKEK